MSLFKIATEMMQYVGFGMAAASAERLAEAENPQCWIQRLLFAA